MNGEALGLYGGEGFVLAALLGLKARGRVARRDFLGVWGETA